MKALKGENIFILKKIKNKNKNKNLTKIQMKALKGGVRVCVCVCVCSAAHFQVIVFSFLSHIFTPVKFVFVFQVI
jgi:hypothetical protein